MWSHVPCRPGSQRLGVGNPIADLPAVATSRQWRDECWHDGDADDVEIVDYHQRRRK